MSTQSTASTFELILDYGYPVAALVSREVTNNQLWHIYALLPQHCYNQGDLAKRWGVDRVLGTAEWRQAQLRRKPMLKPRGILLSFVNPRR